MLNNKHVVLRIDVGSVKRETPTVVNDMIAANMVGSRDSGRNVMQGCIQNSVSEIILSEPQIFSEDFLQNGKQPFVVTTLNTIFGNKSSRKEAQTFAYRKFKGKRYNLQTHVSIFLTGY